MGQETSPCVQTVAFHRRSHAAVVREEEETTAAKGDRVETLGPFLSSFLLPSQMGWKLKLPKFISWWKRKKR